MTEYICIDDTYGRSGATYESSQEFTGMSCSRPTSEKDHDKAEQRGLVVDLFAGGGGASTGIEAALGRRVDVAINHSPGAIAVHAANHPKTLHFTTDIWEVDPYIATRGRPVDVLWASPDCTHHSRAKGGKPRSQRLRSQAHVVTQWARAMHPRLICVENVQEFADWSPLDESGAPVKERKGETFQQWVGELRLLGYSVDWRVLDASLYGAPTKRRRLFIVARHDGAPVEWPEPTHGPGKLPVRAAAECIDWSLPCPSLFERARPLAEKTLWRVVRGIKRYVLDNPAPFLVGNLAPSLIQTGYGERKGQAPRVLNLHEPLGTVVAGGSKHALVAAFLAKHYGGSCPVDAPLPTISAGGIHVAEVRAMLRAHGVEGATNVTVDGEQYHIADVGLRMLEPHELLRAQFGAHAEGYDMSAAPSKTEKIRLIGNSVCPDVAAALVRANARGARRRGGVRRHAEVCGS